MQQQQQAYSGDNSFRRILDSFFETVSVSLFSFALPCEVSSTMAQVRIYCGFVLLLFLEYLADNRSVRVDAWSWTSISPKNAATGAPRVSGHSVATDAKNDRVFLFGGLTGFAGSPATDRLWSFTENEGWNIVKTKTPGPGPRMYAAASILDDSLYVLGGWDPGAPQSGGTFKDEVWSLDLNTLEWNLSENPLPCGPISRHTACKVGDDSIVVHTFRGVLVVDRDGTVREQPTTGEAPDGLSMCAAVPLGDSAMLVFGGSTRTQDLSSDAFVLDTETWEWQKFESENGPAPRASSCAAALSGDKNRCVVFGGACLGEGGYEGGAGLKAQEDTWILTVDGGRAEWVRVEDDGKTHPAPRLAASLSPLGGGGLLLQGGWDPAEGTFDDTWLLEK